MNHEEESFPGAKVILLATAGAVGVALLVALSRKRGAENPQAVAEQISAEVDKQAKKAAKAARKQQKKLVKEAAAVGQHITKDAREVAVAVGSRAETVEQELKAAAWDAHQEAREAESRLRAARQRVAEDAVHLASRIGTEARHLAGEGKDRLTHLRHRDGAEHTAEQEIARLRAEIDALRAEAMLAGRRVEKEARGRLPVFGKGDGGTVQAIAADAAAAAFAQAERSLRSKAPALMAARSKAEAMEILQKELGPTLRETALHAATAALGSWESARERGGAAREQARTLVRDAGEKVSEGAAGARDETAHVREELHDLVAAAEEAARAARERAEHATHEVDALRAEGKRRLWRRGAEDIPAVAHVENGLHETVAEAKDGSGADADAEEHRSKAGLFWGGAGLGLALYALLDAERRERVLQFANEASVQIQELVRDLQGYDDEF